MSTRRKIGWIFCIFHSKTNIYSVRIQITCESRRILSPWGNIMLINGRFQMKSRNFVRPPPKMGPYSKIKQSKTASTMHSGRRGWQNPLQLIWFWAFLKILGIFLWHFAATAVIGPCWLLLLHSRKFYRPWPKAVISYLQGRPHVSARYKLSNFS